MQKYFKKVLKWSVTLLLIGVSLLIITSCFVYYKKDDVLNKVLNHLNDDFKGLVKIKEADISPFENFPYVSVKLNELKIYDDGRSDDKGVEPESIAIGRVGSKTIAVVGMERADAFAIYDITTPTAPVFIKMYKTGDAPEGIIFIPASKSPINQSLIVISSENDGLVKIYKSTKL